MEPVFRIRFFKCVINTAQFLVLKSKLIDIVDEEVDSLRFYHLGDKHKTKVEHVCVERGIKVEEPLIF